MSDELDSRNARKHVHVSVSRNAQDTCAWFLPRNYPNTSRNNLVEELSVEANLSFYSIILALFSDIYSIWAAYLILKIELERRLYLHCYILHIISYEHISGVIHLEMGKNIF